MLQLIWFKNAAELQYRNLEWDDQKTEEDIINYKDGSMDYILDWT